MPHPALPAVSHSTVKLPVPSYQQRLQRMANELASQYLPAALQRWEQQDAAGAGGAGGGELSSSASPSGDSRQAGGSSTGGSGGGSGSDDASSDGSSGASGRDAALLREIERYLFEVQGFKVPGYGRSNLPDRGAFCSWAVATQHATINWQFEGLGLGMLLNPCALAPAGSQCWTTVVSCARKEALLTPGLTTLPVNMLRSCFCSDRGPPRHLESAPGCLTCASIYLV